MFSTVMRPTPRSTLARADNSRHVLPIKASPVAE